MEQKQHICSSVCDRLPTLSANHPWLIDQNFIVDYDRDHVFFSCTTSDLQLRCRIPSGLGRRIWGCFYGWVVLSNHPYNDLWSLWNPVTSKIISLPSLKLKMSSKNGVEKCCLSSPPDDPGSVFMLTASEYYAIVFCRLDCKRKRLKWVEMSYAKQMRRIEGCDAFLFSLTCCKGKAYALIKNPSRPIRLMQIDIVVKGGGSGDTVISLVPYLKSPSHVISGCPSLRHFLIGCCTELFYIELGLNGKGNLEPRTVGAVHVFKLDMTTMKWEEMKDCKDAAFFLNLDDRNWSASYSHAISAEELGGHVHILDVCGKAINSYDLKNRTIALSFMPTSRRHSSLLEHGLLQGGGDLEEIKRGGREEDRENVRDDHSEDKNMESRLFGVPFDVLKMIMEFCVGVEYLNFRATCRQCWLAAPTAKGWRRSKGVRWQTYSLVSPWLMVLHEDRGVISFTDPISGDKYFMKTPPELIGHLMIYCSRWGWLLIRRHLGPLMFFNPFTGDILELPYVPYLDTFFFTAPPTSPDCMVVGFTAHLEANVFIHFVALGPLWFRFPLYSFLDNIDSPPLRFATPYGPNVYAAYYHGGLYFIDIRSKDYTWLKDPESSCDCASPKHNFLVKCDQDILLVVTSMLGESVEVFKLKDSTGWEKIESIGTYTIYIASEACICIEAPTAEMANKIYFQRVGLNNGKVVFYSLETRRYHTSHTEESFPDFMGTKHNLDPHLWIEPSWS